MSRQKALGCGGDRVEDVRAAGGSDGVGGAGKLCAQLVVRIRHALLGWGIGFEQQAVGLDGADVFAAAAS